MAESKQGIYCDYCFEEGQTTNATAFCGKCGKYLCDSCVKQHGKFLPGHKLISGSKKKATACMPCKIHSDQIIELFCEGHKDVFCKLCKLVKHNKCATKYIQEAVKSINVKSEFEASFADLLQQQELMKEKQTESQHKLDSYSKNKNEMKSAVEFLRKQLNEIFDTYEENLNTNEQASLEKLSLKVQLYTSFFRQLESQLKVKKATEREATDEDMLLSMSEMTQLYDSYKQQIDTLEREVADPESVVLQDKRLPSVIQKLLQITSIKEANVDVEVEKEPAAADKCHSNIMKDQSCQVGDFSHDYSEAKIEGVRICHSALTTMDDAEHGSSDDVTEQAMITYPEVSFSDIKSCSLESELNSDYACDDCCFMPDGQAVLCTCSGLMVLDSNMKIKVSLHGHSPNAIDVMDSKNVVVSLPEAKLLQIISIIPNLQLGRNIDLKCKCRCLKCNNNKIFIYSANLFETSCFRYPGIQVLDRTGELLKTIPMFDFRSQFYVTRNGNIVYSCYSDSKKYQIKCITQDNADIFSYPVSEGTDIIIPDDEGNVIIWGRVSKTVSVIKSDGTHGKVLVDLKGKNPRLRSVYYNRHNNTLLVLSSEYIQSKTRDIMQLYKMEML